VELHSSDVVEVSQDGREVELHTVLEQVLESQLEAPKTGVVDAPQEVAVAYSDEDFHVVEAARVEAGHIAVLGLQYAEHSLEEEEDR
jgi:hypothetical protein